MDSSDADRRHSVGRSEGIEAEGLVREFKNGPLTVAGIDLEVHPGEI